MRVRGISDAVVKAQKLAQINAQTKNAAVNAKKYAKVNAKKKLLR
jgi:hypothetical protein